MKSIRLLPLLISVVLLPTLAGCANDRLKQERDALWMQAEELQQLTDQQRAELEQLQMQNQDLATRLSQMEMDLDQARQRPAPAGRARANTGFESIEGVTTYQTPGATHVRVPGDVLFSPGKVELRSQARSTLNQIAQVIRSQYPSQTIRIEGYTDTDPIRKSQWKDNLDLSLERAAAVHRYLQSQGVNKSRMYAAGFGETRPQGSKAQSRRVEIVVVTE